MKIYMDDREIVDITEHHLAVFKDYMPSKHVVSDMQRRLQWVVDTLYTEAFKKFKKRGDHIVQENGVKMVPTDVQEYTKLVISQPNYKDRDARDQDRAQEDNVLDRIVRT